MKSFLFTIGALLLLPYWVLAVEPPPIKEVATEVHLESRRAEDNSFGVRSPVSVDAAYSESETKGGLADNSTDFGPILSYPGHQGGVTAVEVTDSGRRVLTAGLDGKVLQHLLQEPSETVKKTPILSEVVYQSDKPVLALALSPNESYLAIAQYSLALVIDLETREVVRSLSQVSGRITAVAWDPRSELLVFGLASGEVFAWQLEGDKHFKADTKESLEEYRGGATSIQSIIFHPAGRAFFAAERGGVVSLWRLLRTEKEMGLWDESALVDQELSGRKRVVFARLGTRIEDVLLDKKGEYYYVVGANGLIYRWKLRGLKLSDVYVLSDDSPVTLIELDLNLGDKSYPLLVSAGRDHRLKAWCSDELNYIPPVLDPEEALLTAAHAARGTVVKRPTVLNQTVVLQSTIENLTPGQGAGLLWASQKTGNLLSFDLRKLMDSEQLAARRRLCKGDFS
jgi:WD40 repeat protein